MSLEALRLGVLPKTDRRFLNDSRKCGSPFFGSGTAGRSWFRRIRGGYLCLVGEDVVDDVSYMVMSSFVERRGRGRAVIESLTRVVQERWSAEGIARVGGFGSVLNIGTDSTIGSVEVE